MNRLSHRYDVEYVLGKRSCVRLMLEKDQPPGRYMVLCVCKILIDCDDGHSEVDIEMPHDPSSFDPSIAELSFQSDNSYSLRGSSSSSSSSSNTVPTAHLVLTDGWYEIKATLDPLLLQQLRCGKIHPGLKLRIFGASLAPNSAAVSPLDIIHNRQKEGEPLLKLSYNSTRRAKWNAKLGFQRSKIFSIPIHQVSSSGGQIPRLSAVVQRVYPSLVMHKKSGISTIYSMKEYEGISRKTQEIKEQKINEWVERHKMEAERNRTNLCRESDSETPNASQYHADFSSMTQTLPNDKMEEFDRRLRRRREEEDTMMRNAFEVFLRKLESEEISGTEFLTIKLSDDPLFPPIPSCSQISVNEESILKSGSSHSGEAFFTIWRPTEEDREIFREGQRVTLYCVSPYVPKTPSHSSENPHSANPIRLTNTKSTKWLPLPPLKDSRYSPRSSLRLSELASEYSENLEFCESSQDSVREFDVVCILVGVSVPYVSTYSSGHLSRIQYLFVCDDSHTLCVVKVKGTGCYVPYTPLSKQLRVVSMKNLTYRSGSYDLTLNVPLLFASEKTVFCESIVDDHLVQRGDDMTSWLVECVSAVSYIRSQIDRVADVLDDYRLQHRG